MSEAELKVEFPDEKLDGFIPFCALSAAKGMVIAMNDYKDLIVACNKNPWLADREYDLSDYCYSFREVSGVGELQELFDHGNWALRTGYILNDLAFVQQVDGGDEWLALKYEGGRWRDFESISFEHILKCDGEEQFRSLMDRLVNSSIEEYWDNKYTPQEKPLEEMPDIGQTLSL